MHFLVLWPMLSVTVALGTLGIYILFVAGWQVHDGRNEDQLIHANAGSNRSMTDLTSPNRERVLRWVGMGLVAVSLIMFVVFLLKRSAPLSQSTLTSWVAGSTVPILCTLSVVSALASVMCRTPGNAIAFCSLMMVTNAGLFLIANAQFVSVVTVIVYASLFALCCSVIFRCSAARESSQAIHEPLLGCISGSLLAIGLIGASQQALSVETMRVAETRDVAIIRKQSPGPKKIIQTPISRAMDLHQSSFANLSLTLFRDHWLAMEVAGALMLLTLVGVSLILHSSDDLQSAFCTTVHESVETAVVQEDRDSSSELS